MNTNSLKMYVMFPFILAGLILSLPVWAQERQLMEISSEKLYDGSIKVLFILTEVHNPNMFYYQTPSAPKVVCDFFNVKIKPGLRHEIRVDSRFIKNVRMGEHHDPKDKVRVVLDLIPGNKYSVTEVPPEPNIFSVIIRSDDIESDSDESSLDESTLDEDQQETSSTNIETTVQTTTTSTTTTTIPEIYEPETEQNDSEESSVEDMTQNQEDDQDDNDAVFDEKDGWIEELIESNSDLEAPIKWPVQKTFGNLKLIVHLDTDPNGFMALKGYAINMSEDFLYRIQLDFDIYNDNADVIEQAHADFFNVEPGERRKLVVHVGVKTASNFRLMQQLFW